MIIPILAALITPASLATAPISSPAVENKYDWNTQAKVFHIGKDGIQPPQWSPNGSQVGTQSYVNGGFIIDDWNAD